MRIRSTGTGLAGVDGSRWRRRDSYDILVATTERITGVTWWTLAYWVVVHHLAPGIVSAGAGTRVPTLLIETRSELGAVGAYHTLWPAVWRGSNVRGKTRTNTHSVDFSVLTIWSTRVRIAGIFVNYNGINWRNSLTGRQGITRVSRITSANWIMISDIALRIDSARPRAGIPTLLLYTG